MTTNRLAEAFGCIPAAVAMQVYHESFAADIAGTLAKAGADDQGPQAGSRSERFQIQRGLALVPVRGLLTPNFYGLERWFGWSTYHGLEETMALMAANDEVNAIVLEVDSPGGFVLGIEAAAQAVAAAAKVKPVIALVNPMAASGGYWIASQATKIVMTPGSIVGSIGVALTTGASVKPDMGGTRWYDVLSSHARAKWPDPSTEEGMTELRRGLDEAEARFHAAVATGREIAMGDLPAKLSVTDDPADGGAVYGPDDAIARGLADLHQTRAEFWAQMQSEYGPVVGRGKKAHLAAMKAATAAALAAT